VARGSKEGRKKGKNSGAKMKEKTQRGALKMEEKTFNEKRKPSSK